MADHQDPLAQLANIETRQEYLAAGDSQTHLPTATTRTEEVVDVAGTIQEDGEILDNFGNEGEVNGFGYEGDMDNLWNSDVEVEVNIEKNNGTQIKIQN